MTQTADSLPELVQVLTGRTSSAARLAAVNALGRIGPRARDAVPALLNVTSDEDAKVRVAAVQSLGLIGPEAVLALSKLLLHPDKYVRRNATWGLGKLGSVAKGVIKDLCRSLKDEDPRTAAGAAQAIGAMQTDAVAAVPHLIEAMRGTNVVLCRLAAKALSEIGKPALPELITHLSHHDPFVRGEAAVAIGWIGPEASPAVPALMAVLTAPPKHPPIHQTPMPGGKKPDATPESATPEDNARMYAAQALGRIGPAAAPAVSALAQALHDPLPAVGSAAQLALKLIRTPASPP